MNNNKLRVTDILTILQQFEIHNLHRLTQNFVKRRRRPNVFERERVGSSRIAFEVDKDRIFYKCQTAKFIF